jgi:hypothetical protein
VRSPFAVAGRAAGLFTEHYLTRETVRRTFDAVAVGAVIAALLAAVGLLPRTLQQLVAANADGFVFVLGIVTLAGVIVTWQGRTSESEESTHASRIGSRIDSTQEADRDHSSGATDGEIRAWDVPLTAQSPESVVAGRTPPPGAAVTVAAEEDDRIAWGTVSETYGDWTPTEILLDTAVRVVAEEHGVGTREAARRVREGRWTNDPRAAAFLSQDETPTVPPTTRLRDWLAGKQTARQVRATAREIRRHADSDVWLTGEEPSHAETREAVLAARDPEMTDGTVAETDTADADAVGEQSNDGETRSEKRDDARDEKRDEKRDDARDEKRDGRRDDTRDERDPEMESDQREDDAEYVNHPSTAGHGVAVEENR